MFNVLVSAPYLQREFGQYRERFAAAGLRPILPAVRERLEEDELWPGWAERRDRWRSERIPAEWVEEADRWLTPFRAATRELQVPVHA